MDALINDIPGSDYWETIRPISEGWSTDKKYYIKDQQGIQLLLRISSRQSYEEDRHCYNALRKLNNVEICTSKLLDEGLCNQGRNTFRLFTWLEGIELVKIIDSFSEREQYNYGYDTGVMLKKIHEIKGPPDRIKWEEHYNQKIDKKIRLFKSCGITFNKSECLIDYIHRQRNLIIGRPQSFHHGDFHIGNMLLTPENSVAAIDFNRLDFGDPWEEFNRITWSASKSSWFASGQIDGYFSDHVPKVFFELMALHIGVNQLGAIPWAISYGDQELKNILNQTIEVMEWYDHFDRIIPKWYRNKIL